MMAVWEGAGDWAPWLFGACLKASVWLALAVVVLGVAGGRRRVAAGWRHAAGLVVVSGVPLVFVLNLSPLPREVGWRPFVPSGEGGWTLAGAGASERAGDGAGGAVGSAAGGVRAVTGAPGAGSLSPTLAQRVAGFLQPLLADGRVGRVGVTVWAIGVAGGLALLLVRLRPPAIARPRPPSARLRTVFDSECRRSGLGSAPRLLVGDGIVPMTFGVARPAVALPVAAEGWGERDLRGVLRHELAHVVRRDVWWLLVSEAALLPLWWNPLAWWLRRRLAEWREQACDDAVIASGHPAPEYAAFLLSAIRGGLGGSGAGRGIAVPLWHESGRVGRFRHLLDASVSRDPVGRRGLAAVACVSAALVSGGTLSVSCATGSGAGEPAAVPGSDRPAAAPAVAGLPEDAVVLRVDAAFVEVPLEVLGEAADELAERARSEGVEFLSPQEGWEIFNPGRKGFDLMTAPKIWARRGEAARMEVVREFVHATDYDERDGELVPSEFETVKIGVMLGVTARPGSDPDYPVVRLEPVVRELTGMVESERFPGVEEPVFVTLSKKFEGQFRNGSYLLLGERVNVQQIEDKVPVLGDVPLLGNLFRHRSEQTARSVIALRVTVADASEHAETTDSHD